MIKKKGLGRGLSALLDEPAADITSREVGAAHQRPMGGTTMLPVTQIEPNPFQPRAHFSEEALAELAQSIRELGIIQPVTVRKVGYERYQLISGERRFRASQLAGLTEVPAYVRVANDEAMLEMALVENIQREELDPIEVAVSFQRLIDEVSLTQEKLSEKVGKDRATVSNYLRLLKLQPEVQLGLRNRSIGMGHARALITITDPGRQVALFHKIVESQLSVRQVEEIARGLTPVAGIAKPSSARKPLLDKALSKQLSEKLETRVTVKVDGTGKGTIEVRFKSSDELDWLVKRMG
ncbi:MAG: ParB/RepB/Spo0J family partition protein [Flavobacteriales bacterium]|jgi:ParB family chromosome partitioning protein|nr:ParB/RepB/Spo0J family partition protein [Flavobacteriales bacterium]